MLDFYFQFGFMHILVIKVGKRRSILRAATSAISMTSRGEVDIGPSHGGRGSNGTHFAVLSPVVLALSVRARKQLSLELFSEKCGWCRTSFSGKLRTPLQQGRSMRLPGARASIPQAQLCSCRVVESGKNVPELFWISTWLVSLNILIIDGIFNILISFDHILW